LKLIVGRSNQKEAREPRLFFCVFQLEYKIQKFFRIAPKVTENVNIIVIFTTNSLGQRIDKLA